MLGRVSGAHSGLVATQIGYAGIGTFLAALVPVMYAYNGYNSLGGLGGEIVNPQKKLPRAAIVGVLSVVGLYVLINVAYFGVLGFPQVARSQHVASDMVVLLLGDRGAKWLTVAMMISAFGALHVGFLTAPRIPYAMARDGQFFNFVNRVHPVFHTPSGALLFKGCIAAILALTGTYEELYSTVIFATWMFCVLTAIALIRLRRTEPDLPRPFRVLGYPWTPLVFGIAAFALTANLWFVRPVRSSIGVALMLIGVPFFYHWRKHSMSFRAPEVAPSTGA